MATDVTGTRSVYNTLSTTVVDDVTLQGHFCAIEVDNQEASGGASLWCTVGKKGDTLADPVAFANETLEVPAGTTLIIEFYNGASVQPQVKILGSGNKYGVIGMVTANPTRSVRA